LSPAAKALFDDAVATPEQQRRLKVPTDWEVIEQRWRAVADVQPIPEAFFNIGVARERRGMVDEAREAYRRALALDPSFAPAAVNLGVLDEPKDPASAVRYWSELLRRFPDDAVPRIRLAALYEASGQLDEASTLAREALLRTPGSIGAYKVMMRVALRRGQPDLVQLLAVKARKIESGDAEVEALVGDALSRTGDEVAAIAQWKKAVAMQGDFLPARFALLGSALGKQQWEAVVEHADAILRVRPSDGRVRLALGIAYRHLGKPEKALAAYDEAERTDPRLPEVHLARGVLLMKVKEQCEPAAGELRRYLSEAGPAAAGEGPAPRLLRECEAMVVASRQAADAARELEAEAARERARKAATGAPVAHEATGERSVVDEPTVKAVDPVGTTSEGGAVDAAPVPTR
jgi:tetratricopeptide (TPR) repeat protein